MVRACESAAARIYSDYHPALWTYMCSAFFSLLCFHCTFFHLEKSQVLNLHSCQHFLGIQFRLVHLLVSTEAPPPTNQGSSYVSI